MSFENLGLCPEILTTIKFKGYVEPTPIQAQAIPVVLEGKDVLAGAQTGTGKTAAFTLPILEFLSSTQHKSSNYPRALVITPTRELAAQVAESVEEYGKGLGLRSTVIFGGVSINPQIKRIRRGVDIVIGTPGRLLDLVGQKVLNLSRVEILTLDEADRMLDMGFIHDIRKIISHVPKKRQTLFFSATYSKEIKALADTILQKPELIEVARENTAAETVDQGVYFVSKNRKRELLAKLIKDGDWNQVLVFSRTKHGANRLAKQLESDGIPSAAIHGNKSQGARTRALADFKSNDVRVLVATDIAARGLDIDKLPHVVNYDLPQQAEDYVHRIGRTGRAGCSGQAISLVMCDEYKQLRAIQRMIKKDIPLNIVEGITIPEAEFLKNAADSKGVTTQSRSQNRGRGVRKSGGTSMSSEGNEKKSQSNNRRRNNRRRPSRNSN